MAAMRPWWHNVEIGLRLGLNRKPIKPCTRRVKGSFALRLALEGDPIGYRSQNVGCFRGNKWR
ncbi:hypothetical protein HMPREF1640_04245 [Prevotella sp. S7-1-8]|nr:hypothetical protein HMPREF1640_04245 [Prevotella sp. S7-1-8]